MTVNTKNLVSITEANQNFSRVARLVDENGAAVILKNNVPRYVLLEFSQAEREQLAEDEDVLDPNQKTGAGPAFRSDSGIWRHGWGSERGAAGVGTGGTFPDLRRGANVPLPAVKSGAAWLWPDP